MFDEIIFETNEYDSILRCSEGHLMSRQNFQTKSLEGVGYSVHVYPGGLLKSIDGWAGIEPVDFTYRYSPYGVIFYAFCNKCSSKTNRGDLQNFLMIIDKDKVRSIEKVEER